MMRKTLPLAILMLVLSASMAWCSLDPSEYCTFYYYGNVDPMTPGSAGSDISGPLSFDDNDKIITGTVVSDPDTDDTLALEVIDTGSEPGSGIRCVYTLVRTGGVAIDYGGATILGRIKTLSDTHGLLDEACGNLGILDPVTASPFSSGNSVALHWGGENGHVADAYRGEATTIAGDANYHIFRVTIKGYVDPVPEGAKDETWNEGFDTYTVNTALDGQDQWTGGTPGGVTPNPSPPPDEIPVSGLTVMNEPLGSSGHGQVLAFVCGDLVFTESIPVFLSPDPVTNEMVLEFDMFRDASNIGGFCWYVNVNDRSGANIAQWNGTGSAARGRINSTSTITASATLTSGGWSHLKMVINASTNKAQYYVDGVELTPLGGITINAAADEAIGEIHISSPYNFQGRNVFYLDNFDVAGAHYVDPPEARRITVYKDEDSDPVLDFLAGEVDSYDMGIGNAEGFMFGTDVTEGMQSIRFDWISGTNRGAFAPGEEVPVLGGSLIPSTSVADSILEAKQMPAPTTVIIDGATVSCEINDENNTQIGFGIQTADRTDGIRVAHILTGEEGGVPVPGAVVNLVGVTSVDRGELHIIAPMVTVVSEPPEVVFPPALSMNNKASGGGVFASQPAVWTYTGRAFDLDNMSYPDGALNGQGPWEGSSVAGHVEVSGGELKVHHYPGPADTVCYTTYDPLAGSFKYTFNVKKGAPTSMGDNREFWSVIAKCDNALQQEIGRWTGFSGLDVVKAQRVEGDVTTDIYTQALFANYISLGIEMLPNQGAGGPGVEPAHKAKFYVNAVEVGSIDFGKLDRRPGSITIYNISRSEFDTGYVWMDDFGLTNMTFPFGLDIENTGANNVGLFVRLYGTVTAVKSDGATDDDNYFYIDDGSGLLDLTATGIRCKPPSMASAVLPNVGDYVVADGVMGVRDGARYLWTWDWQLQ